MYPGLSNNLQQVDDFRKTAIINCKLKRLSINITALKGDQTPFKWQPQPTRLYLLLAGKGSRWTKTACCGLCSEKLCCLLFSLHLVTQPASSLFAFWPPQAEWTSWASTLPLYAYWLKIRMSSMRSLNPSSERSLPQNTCTCQGTLMCGLELIIPPGPAALVLWHRQAKWEWTEAS